MMYGHRTQPATERNIIGIALAAIAGALFVTPQMTTFANAMGINASLLSAALCADVAGLIAEFFDL